jgi:protein required for attachment to host cells
MKNKRTWILIADGSHARTFLNTGVGKGLTAVPDGDFEGSNMPNREINADKPGMTFNSVGDGRRRKQPSTDPHRQAKYNFARELTAFLEHGYKQNRFDRLILVAPPAMLGDLRTIISGPVRQLLIGELAKDLVHLNERELPSHLADLLSV